MLHPAASTLPGVDLPTDDRPTVVVPNHTGMLDGSLLGSVLAEAQWTDGAAMAFLAQEAGCVVTTWTGLVQWYGFQPNTSGFVPLSIAELSL